MTEIFSESSHGRLNAELKWHDEPRARSGCRGCSIDQLERVWVLVLWYSVLEEKIGVGTWYSMKFGVGPGTRKVVFWSIGTWYSGNITPITAQELGLNMTYCPSARVVVRLVESEESGNLHLAVNPNSKFNCIGFIRLRRLVV